MPMVGQGPAYVSCPTPPATVVPSELTIQQVVGPAAGVVIAPGSLVFADTSLGTVGLVPPASGVFPVGTYFGVADSGNNAATDHINIAGASIAIEDPNAPGTFPAGVNITTNSQVVWWIWGPRPGGVNGWKIWAEGAISPTPALQPLATLANGAADQLVGMKHDDSAPNYFTVGGDLTLANGSFTVVAISGASPLPITPAILQWPKATVSPSLKIAAQTTDTACTDVHIVAQAPFASATGTNRNPGNVDIDLASPTNGGTTEGYLRITRGGTQIMQLGSFPAGGSLVGMFAGSGAAGTGSLVFEGDGTSVSVINGPGGGSLRLTIGTVPQCYITSGHATFFNGNTEITGGGTNVLGLANASVVPASTPTGGGLLYSDAGAGKWKGTSGTVTTFGPAEPHCPSCGSDFMTEHESEVFGYLAVCLKCMADELGQKTWILREKPRKA